ncbi:MAG: hypothetical protein OTJ98_07695 [Dehalococcoidia bacterium]|nr:hypothetical protein [Dehalococcoidia bacterium]
MSDHIFGTKDYAPVRMAGRYRKPVSRDFDPESEAHDLLRTTIRNYRPPVHAKIDGKYNTPLRYRCSW